MASVTELVMDSKISFVVLFLLCNILIMVSIPVSLRDSVIWAIAIDFRDELCNVYLTITYYEEIVILRNVAVIVE